MPSIGKHHSVTTIDELKEAPISAERFQLPKGLTYQEPVYGVPGGN